MCIIDSPPLAGAVRESNLPSQRKFNNNEIKKKKKEKTSRCGRCETFHSRFEWQQGGIRMGGVHVSALTNQVSV